MIETLIESIKEILANPWALLFGTVTLIEIAPIKLNPWKWIGNLLIGDLRNDVKELRKEVSDIKVENWRWNVLDFANSCKHGRRHTIDEWQHTINQLADYDAYIKKNEIRNGVFEEDAKYLRSEYRKHCEKNDFL